MVAFPKGPSHGFSGTSNSQPRPDYRYDVELDLQRAGLPLDG
jgi:hypothetical protein